MGRRAAATSELATKLEQTARALPQHHVHSESSHKVQPM